MERKCKWLEPFNQICCNGDCPYVADNPPMYYRCLGKEDCKYYEVNSNEQK